jgi:uncharacterized membrane protein YedE/YeeE
MTDMANPAALVTWGGFLLALVFGAVANKSNFCIMGAISDVVNMGHWGRVRMWMLAVAVAIIGASLLQLSGLVDLTRSLYPRPTLPWLSLIVGGTCFGFGMTLAGGCANKNLIRLGGGSLRSLVVLVFVGISGYMTLKGLFGQWRATLLDPVAIDLTAFGLANASLPALLARLTGLPTATAWMVLAATISLALLAFVFRDARFRRNRLQVISSAILGLVIVGGWYLTGHLGYGENRETLETVYFATNSRTLESLSFVAPTAYSLELLMLWTDKSLRLTFGIASAAGVVLGSLAAALATRRFRWEGFASLEDLSNQLVGAMLMGFGGVTAVGCTIGQGMSGLSTLALGSLLAVAGIILGAWAAMQWLKRRL